MEMTLYHPLADLFPPMSEAEFADLKADIADNGLHEPIWTLDGMVLDGRHRHRACVETGVPLETREYDGDDPLGFVLSLNLKRRHLNEAQRAMIAARMATLPRGANQHAQICAPSQAEAADRMQVSRRSVQTAAKVQRKAAHEVVEAVRAGNMSLHAAEATVHNHRALGTGENEWHTPSKYVEAVRQVLGTIDLDPASNPIAQKTVRAGAYYTATDDGLTKQWHGRVFLNPPYAQPLIAKFAKKAVAEFITSRMTECIVITHNYTDTRWFQSLAKRAAAICFPKTRIQFESPTGEKAKPTQGQAIFYLGDRPEAFATVFKEFGVIR